MNQVYRDTTTKMEEAGVKTDYIIGWQGGFLKHPKREEQRITEGYEAGYNDGYEGKTDAYSKWA
jgi:hypothetical protein